MQPLTAPELIETLRAEPDGRIALLERHMMRLRRSSAALGYVCPDTAIRSAIQVCAAQHRGSAPLRLRLLLRPDGRFSLSSTVLTPLPARLDVRIWPAGLHRDEPLLRHKTTHRPWYESASLWLASHPETFDAIYFNEYGELCEGTRSNVYVLRDGVWLTPPQAAGCLPGVQRQALLCDGSAVEAALTEADLHAAEGIRLSNALRGWFDVRLAQHPG